MRERDPLSELWDPGTGRLLDRLYAARRGEWVRTRAADPSLRQVALAMFYGQLPNAADSAKRAVGRRMTRWEAAFERSAYYWHKWYYTGGRRSAARRTTPARTSALEIRWGRRRPGTGVIPPGREVQLRLRPGGPAARAAVMRMDDDERIFLDDAEPGAKWGDPDVRDW